MTVVWNRVTVRKIAHATDVPMHAIDAVDFSVKKRERERERREDGGDRCKTSTRHHSD